MNQVLKRFLKDRKVAALAPTSKFAVRKICEHINFSRDLSFVEYGPGDGVLSKEILARMTPESSFIGIETNADFVRELKTIADSRLKIVHDRAENVCKIIESPADFVFSSIPCTFLPASARRNLVRDTYNILAPGGSFIVFQYSPLMKNYLEKVFEEVKLSIVPLNVPTMFIMAARKILNCGRGEIRTHERIAPQQVFETGPFNRSGTSPL